jgi:NAD-specific glutamate dehydrogenase
MRLAVIEVSRNGDHRLADRLAEIRLCGLLHLAEDEGADLARRIFLALRLDPGIAVVATHDGIGHQLFVLADHRVFVAAADEALDGIQRV